MTWANERCFYDRFWRKTVSLSVALIFTFTNSVFAVPGYDGYFGQGAPALGFDAKILAENPFGIKVDEKQGSIAGFFDGNPDRPLVVYLQDAHGNISAQQNTKKIIAGIAGGKKQKTIFCLTEGAEGFVSMAPLEAFMWLGYNPENLLLSKGMINGPELAAAGFPNVAVWGVEDRELYEKNLEAALSARKDMAANLEFIGGYRARVRDLAIVKSSKSLKLLFQANDELSKNDANLQEVTKVVKEFIRSKRFEIMRRDPEKPLSVADIKAKFPNAYRLMQLEYLWEDARAELEAYQAKRFQELKDKQEARGKNSDRGSAIRDQEKAKEKGSEVEKRGTKIDHQEKTEERSAVPKPPITDHQSLTTAPKVPTHLDLLPEAPAKRETDGGNKIPLVSDLFEGLKKQSTTRSVEKYLRTTEEIDSYLVINELRELIRTLKESFYSGANEKLADTLYEKSTLLEKLAKLELTPQEYSRIKQLGPANRESLLKVYQKLSGRSYDGPGKSWQVRANIRY